MHYEDIYAQLVSKIECYEKAGHRISRYGAVLILVNMIPYISAVDLSLIDKLYADGFVSA